MTVALARPRRIIALVIAAGVAVVAAFVLWPESGHATVPYDDGQSAGLLTLCSADGDPVTEGSTADQPFADVVLGTTGLPAGVDPAGAVATVFAYQPRQGIATTEYSGTPLTAASVVADPEHPAAAVQEDGWSIGDFVTAFPATYDGYVQLRLYLGTSGAGTLTENPYDTADLRVDGDHWELVRGGHASCADAASAVVR